MDFMNKNLFFLFLVLMLIQISGCSTARNGMTQKISVKTVDRNTSEIVYGATCELKNKNGAYYKINNTPTSLEVSRGMGNLKVVCYKNGFESAETEVPEEFSAAFSKGASLSPWMGAADLLTGAAAEYKSETLVKMQKYNKIS